MTTKKRDKGEGVLLILSICVASLPTGLKHLVDAMGGANSSGFAFIDVHRLLPSLAAAAGTD
mgnify:CR=1 FL=1